MSEQPQQPVKPYPSWPMYAHPSGQWCRKHNRKPYYFGSWRGDWKEAEKDYNWRWPHIEAGRPDPKYEAAIKPGPHNLEYICNWYVNERRQVFEQGRIQHHAYFDSKEAADVTLKRFGKTRMPETISAHEWGQFRTWMEDQWGACKLRRIVGYIRSMGKMAYDAGLTPGFRFGTSFPNVSRDSIRDDHEEMRRQRGEKLIPYEELAALWKAHTKPYDAFFLLGLNAGFLACDCSELPQDAILHEEQAIDFSRVKTNVPRYYVPLWPETYQAIVNALSNRGEINESALALAVRAWELRKPRDGKKATERWEREKPDWNKLVFISRMGVPYVTQRVNYENGLPCSRSAKDTIGEYFGDLLVEKGLKRKGIGFATLRHNYFTRATEYDEAAARFIMGHRDPSMGAWYKHLDDQKIARLWALVEKLRGDFLYPSNLGNGQATVLRLNRTADDVRASAG